MEFTAPGEASCLNLSQSLVGRIGGGTAIKWFDADQMGATEATLVRGHDWTLS